MINKKLISALQNNRLVQEAQIFALMAHSDTNHYYDEYLPYEFHLRMVVKEAYDNIHLVEHLGFDYMVNVICAAWLHDTIEDARKNYNDIKKGFNVDIAEMVRAVTNYGRGRDRDERMPDYIYAEIKTTPGAAFIKICDRIANAQYSKMTGSSMYNKYQKEQPKFRQLIETPGELKQMWEALDELLLIPIMYPETIQSNGRE